VELRCVALFVDFGARYSSGLFVLVCGDGLPGRMEREVNQAQIVDIYILNR
jgi:hypothetical protein